MRLNFKILILLALLSCKDAQQKYRGSNLSNNYLKEFQIENDQNNFGYTLPSYEELNRKQFYYTRSIPNNPNFKSNLYCFSNEKYPISTTPIMGHYKVYLNAKEVVTFCDSMLGLLPPDHYTVKDYTRLRMDAIKSKHQLVKCNRKLLPELLMTCEFKIFDILRKDYPDRLILKYYNTMCTQAEKDYDLIYTKGDTCNFINHLELCIN